MNYGLFPFLFFVFFFLDAHQIIVMMVDGVGRDFLLLNFCAIFDSLWEICSY